MLRGLLASKISTFDVNSKNRIEIFFCHLSYWFIEGDSGIVDQNIDFAKALKCLLKQPLDVGYFANKLKHI